MFNINEIKELITAIDNSSLTEILITSANGDSIKFGKMPVVTDEKSIVSTAAEMDAKITAKTEAVVSTAPAQPAAQAVNCETIDSPMVGVFYAAASPESEPFVKVGQKVNKGDTVCIIEAMKLMNEIQAEKSGTISEICVANGDIIEFGQPLFKLS